VTSSSERPETALWSAHRDGPVLRVSGALDALTFDEVAERLTAEIAAGVSQIDLSGVSTCAAAGVRALLSGREAARARRLVLSLGCPPEVARVLDLCGVAELDGWLVVDMA
jgi:anti-anti-sigma factor